MKAIKRLTGTALQATASGCTLTLRINRDGSEIGTIYILNGSLELLEKYQEIRVAFMEIVNEELDLFEFEHHPDSRITLRLRTKDGRPLEIVMTDVVERIPVTAPAW